MASPPIPLATSLAASPLRSSTVSAAPARESLSAQARPIPLAAPVTRALRPVRSTLTDDGPDTVEASFMSLLSSRGSDPDTIFPQNAIEKPCMGQSTLRGGLAEGRPAVSVLYDAARGCSEVSGRRRYVPAGSPTPSAKALRPRRRV